MCHLNFSFFLSLWNWLVNLFCQHITSSFSTIKDKPLLALFCPISSHSIGFTSYSYPFSENLCNLSLSLSSFKFKTCGTGRIRTFERLFEEVYVYILTIWVGCVMLLITSLSVLDELDYETVWSQLICLNCKSYSSRSIIASWWTWHDSTLYPNEIFEFGLIWVI